MFPKAGMSSSPTATVVTSMSIIALRISAVATAPMKMPSSINAHTATTGTMITYLRQQHAEDVDA